MNVNLGCGPVRFEGYLGFDIQPGPTVDVVGDFTKGLPWRESSVDNIAAYDFIEHIHDKVYTLREIYRVLKPGGLLHIQVPDAEVGCGAFRDPTHVSFWCSQSFMDIYMAPGPFHPGRYHYAVEHLAVTEVVDSCRWVVTRLRAVKAERPSLPSLP